MKTIISSPDFLCHANAKRAAAAQSSAVLDYAKKLIAGSVERGCFLVLNQSILVTVLTSADV